jgi:hypothetical protein
LDSISAELQQLGVDERVEIDSDTQDVPGVPEFLGTILKKIEERSAPNPNVMFEYGYAIKAKGRDRIICVMNTFYGGSDPSELPFDLRHARAPIRYSLAPNSSPDEKKKVLTKLQGELFTAAKLIIQNLPSSKAELPRIDFQRPHFSAGQELTPEGDFAGQNNPTYFDESMGFVYSRGRPVHLLELSIAKIKSMEIATSALTIASGSQSGSFGTNKFGRIVYAIKSSSPRVSADYVQYFRTGEIEIVNGSYLPILRRNGGSAINADYLVNQIMAPMLKIAQGWLEKLGDTNFIVDIGIIGTEGWRLTLTNFGSGPMIHVPKVSVQKKVDKGSVLLWVRNFAPFSWQKSALLSELNPD